MKACIFLGIEQQAQHMFQIITWPHTPQILSMLYCGWCVSDITGLSFVLYCIASVHFCVLGSTNVCRDSSMRQSPFGVFLCFFSLPKTDH